MLLVKQLILSLVQDTCFICRWNVPYCQCSGSGGVSAPSRQMHSPCSPCKGEHCSAAAAHCIRLLCFCWESVCNFPPLLPQGQEMSQCFCSVLTLSTAFDLLSLVGGGELSCSEEIRQRLLSHELLKLFWPLFVKNKNLESSSRILGDP